MENTGYASRPSHQERSRIPVCYYVRYATSRLRNHLLVCVYKNKKKKRMSDEMRADASRTNERHAARIFMHIIREKKYLFLSSRDRG